MAKGMSADGNIIVGRSGNRAFLWNERDGMVALDLPGRVRSSVATAATYNGSTIVGIYGEQTQGGVFVWDEGKGMRDLQFLLEGAGVDMTGWALHDIVSITPDGNTIIGTGRHESSRERQAWIVTDFNSLAGNPMSVPEPSTYGAAAASGFMVLILLRRTRRSSAKCGR
jgi:hypothetical protein